MTETPRFSPLRPSTISTSVHDTPSKHLTHNILNFPFFSSGFFSQGTVDVDIDICPAYNGRAGQDRGTATRTRRDAGYTGRSRTDPYQRGRADVSRQGARAASDRGQTTSARKVRTCQSLFSTSTSPLPRVSLYRFFI